MKSIESTTIALSLLSLIFNWVSNIVKYNRDIGYVLDFPVVVSCTFFLKDRIIDRMNCDM